MSLAKILRPILGDLGMTAASGLREELGSVAFRLEGSSSNLARGMDSAYASHRDRLTRTKEE